MRRCRRDALGGGRSRGGTQGPGAVRSARMANGMWLRGRVLKCSSSNAPAPARSRAACPRQGREGPVAHIHARTCSTLAGTQRSRSSAQLAARVEKSTGCTAGVDLGCCACPCCPLGCCCCCRSALAAGEASAWLVLACVTGDDVALDEVEDAAVQKRYTVASRVGGGAGHDEVLQVVSTRAGGRPAARLGAPWRDICAGHCAA